MHKLHAELASIEDDFETKSVELKYTGLDKQNEAQTHKQTEAIESEVVGADGLDLNLKNMTANTKDFSFYILIGLLPSEVPPRSMV